MTEKTSKLSKDQETYAQELTDSLKLGIHSLEECLKATLEPFSDMHEVITKLEKDDKSQLITKALNFYRVVAADVDSYAPEIKALKKEVIEVLKKQPTRPRHLGGYSAKALSLGSLCAELNNRILQTTVAMSDDYVTLLTEAGIK